MTTPYYQDDAVTLHHGDCLDVLATLPDASVDAVVTDPPYALEFMGRSWDGWSSPRAFQEWCGLWAAECLRVLKPGGHLLAFGGSRTWHRLAVAVEDAGFEMRDSIAWLYGSGFPKSLDVSKAIDKAAGAEREVVGTRPTAKGNGGTGNDFLTASSRANVVDVTAPATPDAERWQGWGTALKPAFEPVVVGRKPLAGTVAANVLTYGAGALNIDGCRVPMSGEDREKFVQGDAAWRAMNERRGKGRKDNEVYGEYGIAESAPHDAGRWPTNVVLDESQAEVLDRQSGERPSSSGAAFKVGGYGGSVGLNRDDRREIGFGDSGGASRFFPTFRYEAKAPTSERPRAGETAHPTVKPLDLMRWLVRLVTPPGGTVLEPFAGSGTTAEACVIEGFHCIAVEREADYLPLIVQRLTKPIPVALDLGGIA